MAAAGSYTVDPAHTFPHFEINHLGFSTMHGRFNATEGKLTVDLAGKTGSVDVKIDANSIDTGYPLFNEHLQAEDFFDTAKYPTITYKSTAVKFKGDQPVEVEGNLTIKGVTRPVTLTLGSFQVMPHPILKKDALGANATARIKRSEFNAGKYAPHVSDDVTLIIAVEAVKQ